MTSPRRRRRRRGICKARNFGSARCINRMRIGLIGVPEVVAIWERGRGREIENWR
ncbi:hypothetical protein B0H19DRAFT_1156200 [Mycena capillaripes]|nr:hypothetical protein B0H19DRAFT_1156200 [Mycena capillaripes]